MSRKDAKYRGSKCLNCNTPLDISERYCHYCGQLNSTKKVTFSDFIEEFFSNFYAYDSRLRNTFSHLFTKPAFVARQIIEGKRQTFANPFRLFLSIVIFYFLIVGLFNFTPLDSNIKIEENKTLKDTIIKTTKPVYKDFSTSGFINKRLIKAQNFFEYLDYNKKGNASDAFTELQYENSKENRYIFKRVKIFQDYIKNKSNSEVVKSLKTKLPFIIFLLLPFVTIAFALTFRKKDLSFVDHMIFVYTIATVLYIKYFIDFIALKITGVSIAIITLLLFIFYVYKSLRKFYHTSRWKTLFKLVILLFTSILIGLPVFLIIFLGVFLIT